MVAHLRPDTVRLLATHRSTVTRLHISSSMYQVDAGKYLLLHHRQPLACRFCRGAPHAPCAIHYHWALAQHTGSPVPCLGTMVNHTVKNILNLKPNLCFPVCQLGIIYNTCILLPQLKRAPSFLISPNTTGKKQRFGLVTKNTEKAETRHISIGWFCITLKELQKLGPDLNLLLPSIDNTVPFLCPLFLLAYLWFSGFEWRLFFCSSRQQTVSLISPRRHCWFFRKWC